MQFHSVRMHSYGWPVIGLIVPSCILYVHVNAFNQKLY